MKARKYNKRIEIYQTTSVNDGFGGKSIAETKIGTSWANITTLDRANRTTEDGTTDSFKSIIVRTRKRNDLKYNIGNIFIKYRGVKYVIQQQPINIGFQDREIEFLATGESIKTVNDVSVIGGTAFTYTLPFQLA